MKPTQLNTNLSPSVTVTPVVVPSSDKVNNEEVRGLPDLERDLVQVWNTPFDRVTMQESIERIGELVERRKPNYVITANLNYVMLNNKDKDLAQVTDRAALVVADGNPIVMRTRVGERRLPERVAGSEMIYHLAEAAAQNGWSIYFLGGEDGIAERCATRLAEMYPGMRIAGVESPPFRALTEQEQAEQDQRIQSSDADILLVAFGQPKGEKWIAENHERLGVPVSIQLGASFDFVAGNIMRAPKFWQTIGMEWFYRMVNDPRRLVKRYAQNGMFLFCALIEDWKRQVSKWGMSVE